MAVSPSKGVGVVASVIVAAVLPDPTRLGRDWLLRSAESFCKFKSPSLDASLASKFSILDNRSSIRSIFFSLSAVSTL